MNNKIKTILFAGLTLPAIVSAQLYTKSTPGTGGFDGLMADMYSAQKQLYSTNNLNSDYSEITYTTNYNPLDSSGIGTGRFKTNATNPQFPAQNPFPTLGTNLFFVEIEQNITQFFFKGKVNIGFFGNESVDSNKFMLNVFNNANPAQTRTEDPLFAYDDGPFNGGPLSGTSTHQSTTLVVDAGLTLRATFSHQDFTWNKVASQENELKFRMYRSFNQDTQLFGNEYIFGIDDRMVDSVDYDDGFLYIEGGVTPVPEPSHIAALAVLGMGAFLTIRRRIASKKA